MKKYFEQNELDISDMVKSGRSSAKKSNITEETVEDREEANLFAELRKEERKKLAKYFKKREKSLVFTEELFEESKKEMLKLEKERNELVVVKSEKSENIKGKKLLGKEANLERREQADVVFDMNELKKFVESEIPEFIETCDFECMNKKYLKKGLVLMMLDALEKKFQRVKKNGL